MKKTEGEKAMKKRSLGISILGLILFLILFQLSKGRKSQLNRNEAQVLEQSRRGMPESSRSPSLPLPKVPLNKSSLESGLSDARLEAWQELWQSFKLKYGKALRAEFSADHRLISIVGGVGSGSVSEGFDSQSEAKLRARAEEMLRALSALIGEKKDWPVEFQEARVGAVTGQVFFRQTYDGLAVKPVGGIKVDLGPKGELLGFYSDYVAQVKTVLPAALSELEVEEQAKTVLNRLGLSKAVSSGLRTGEKVIWVSGGVARVAYEYFFEGRSIVIDAQSGKTLLSRDRRNY